MRLDYLAAESSDWRVLRIYDFTPTEANELHRAIAALASGAAGRIEVDRMPFVEPAGGCRLALVNRPWDQGVVRRGGPTEFECGFTPRTWDEVAGLVEPFALGTVGFQWLAGTPGEAPLLLSTCGAW